MKHVAVAEIDLDALAANTARAGQVSGSAAVMGVVKADAYGHGMAPIAAALRRLGMPWLGVAHVGEALALRASGDTGPILAWLIPPGTDGLAEAITGRVDLGIGAAWLLDEIAVIARTLGRRARVHVKVDTGLGRGGAAGEAWTDLVERARRSSDAVDVVGVWSHLACADDPEDPATDQQIAAFEQASDAAAVLRPRVRHLAASAGVFTRPDVRYDLVRLGISLYGLTPGPLLGTAADLGLTPVMTLRTRVGLTKDVPAGHGVSYGLTWRAPEPTRLALIPLGYGDGLPRSAQGARVAIAGRQYPVVGRIAMDQLVVDVGPDGPVREGDDVHIFGPGAHGEPTADDWARWSGTIGYEIVTRITARVARSYVGGAP